MALPPLWQVTPLGLLVVLVGIVHEVGLLRLAARQSPAHALATRRRSLFFYAGLIGLLLVVSSPLDRWAMPWLSLHMVTHVFEMFYLPPLLIVGGPLVPLLFALPVDTRRKVLSGYYRSKDLGWLRALLRAATGPVAGIALFNGVMVLWHIPAVYNWASWHDWAMNWLMAPSFVLAGIVFWRIILPSHPCQPRGLTRMQVAAIVVTAFEMLVLAMALAVFTKTPWYSMNVLMDGPAAALRDQRWGAGILWVCGDFWAIPALVLVAYRVYGQDGGVSASFERALGRA